MRILTTRNKKEGGEKKMTGGSNKTAWRKMGRKAQQTRGGEKVTAGRGGAPLSVGGHNKIQTFWKKKIMSHPFEVEADNLSRGGGSIKTGGGKSLARCRATRDIMTI